MVGRGCRANSSTWRDGSAFARRWGVRRCLAGSLLPLHVVAEQNPLIAEVELPPGDDRVRPRLLVAAVGRREAALLLVALWRGLHQRHRPVLAADVQPAVGRGHRPLADAAV